MPGKTFNWKQVNNASEIELDGINVFVERNEGKAITSITFMDKLGHSVRIDPDYNSMKVRVPAPPRLVTKYHLSGEVNKLTVSEFFDYVHEAEARKDELLRGFGNSDESESLVINKVEVPEED